MIRNIISKHFIILPVFLLAIIFLVTGIDKPLIGHHDWNSVWFATIARNHLRYGLLTTKFGQVLNVGQGYSKKDLGFHTHHPPLLPILVAASFSLFGESDFSTRLVPVVATFIAVFLFYVIGNELYAYPVGLIASLLTVVTPIVIYFSKIAVHETVVIAFLLFAFYQYILWIKNGKSFHFVLLILGIILAQLTGWAGYYLAFWLFLHSFFFQERRQARQVFFLLPLSIIMFFLHLLHTKILTGSFFGGGLLDVFFFRFNPEATSSLYGFTYPRFLVQEARFIIVYFTRIVVIASVIWLILFFIKRLPRKESFIFILLPFGLTHMLLFRNLSFIHDYMIYYLLPFFVLSSTAIFHQILKKIAYRPVAALLMVILIFFIATERLAFLQALFATHEGEKGRQLGLLIKKKIEPEEYAFVGSNKFREFFDVFIAYYSDRRVVYGEELPDGWQKKFRLIVRPKEHDALSIKDKEFLDKHYKAEDNGRFIWYDLKQIKTKT